jgi:hypothetical protein
MPGQSSFAKATEDTILRSKPPGVGSERRMVEAAGVEPCLNFRVDS